MVVTCGFTLFKVKLLIEKCLRKGLVSLLILALFSLPSAVAVYTGMETKMALNYQSKSQKRSAVEKYD